MVPGLGQLFQKRYLPGVAFIVAYVLYCVIGVWLWLGNTLNLFLLFGFSLIGYGLFLYSSLNAAFVKDANTADEDKLWFSIFLTFIWPGIGHFYAKKWIFGILYVLLIIFSIGAGNYSDWLSIFLLLLILFVASLHIYKIHYSRDKIRRSTFIYCLLVLLFIGFCQGNFGIFGSKYGLDIQDYRGSSMYPTLPRRCEICIDFFSYRFRDPRIGEVVVIDREKLKGKYSSSESRGNLVKRIAAKGGDTIRISEDGFIIINGKALKTPADFEGIAPEDDRYHDWPIAQDSAYAVPEGMYFVLGDNIFSSFDSRFFGAIPRNTIIARVNKVVWPLEHQRVLPQPNNPEIEELRNLCN